MNEMQNDLRSFFKRMGVLMKIGWVCLSLSLCISLTQFVIYVINHKLFLFLKPYGSATSFILCGVAIIFFLIALRKQIKKNKIAKKQQQE